MIWKEVGDPMSRGVQLGGLFQGEMGSVLGTAQASAPAAFETKYLV